MSLIDCPPFQTENIAAEVGNPEKLDLADMSQLATKKARAVASGRDTSPAAGPRSVFVLSDSTGNLARHMLSAFMTQFPPGSLHLRVHPFLRTSSQVQSVLEQAKEQKAAVCHAMVSQEHKEFIDAWCRRTRLPCRDLTGGIVEFLSQATGVQAKTNLNALHRLDETYRRRIGAVEYTLAHDDGLGLETLSEADVVLVGVSRTSKTPTSIYLGQQGFRVANVALALGVEPPSELLALPRERVIGLLIDPRQLVMIRTHRDNAWGNQAGDYGDPDHVARELAWARRFYNDNGWKTIDVTDQAIEETAAKIVQAANLHAPQRRTDRFTGLE